MGLYRRQGYAFVEAIALSKVKTPADELRNRICGLSHTNESWVTDGNYFKHLSAYTPRVTDIICPPSAARNNEVLPLIRFPSGLDYALHVTFIQLLLRTWRRWWNGEILFGTTGLKEDWRQTLFTRESILWCAG